MPLSLSGRVGKLKVSYRDAANLGKWDAAEREVLGPTELSVTARVNFANDFWIHQRPLTLGLWMDTAWWVWERVELVALSETVLLRVHGNPSVRLAF